MKNTQPITPTTVRPLRVLSAIAACTVLLMAAIFIAYEGNYRYQLWRAGGIWCATLDPDGTITRSLGADACGY